MTFSEFRHLLRTKWLTILIGLLAGLIVAALAVRLTPTEFEAQASSLVTVTEAANITDLRSGQEYSAAQALTYAKLVETDQLHDRVSRQTGLSSAQVGAALTATVEPQTSVVTIVARRDSAESAAGTANSAIDALGEVARVVDGGVANKVSIVTLSRATPPAKPVQPQPGLYFALGCLVGGALGFAAAALSLMGRRPPTEPAGRGADGSSAA